MKRLNLRTLTPAATANGTLIGDAVRDRPDAPLFEPTNPRTGHHRDCLCSLCTRDVPATSSGAHITLSGDTVTSEPTIVERIES